MTTRVRAGGIAGNTITTSMMQNDIVTNAKMADDAVDSDVLANDITIPSGNTFNAAASGGMHIPGTVIQVVQGTLDTTASVSGSTEADTGLTATITPKFSTSKILVTVKMCCGGNERYNAFYLYRGSTKIGQPAADGSRTSVFLPGYGDNSGTIGDTWQMTTRTGSFLDSPATTSATTYKITFNNSNNNGTFYINRPYTDSNAAWAHRGQSVIQLQEIAQ